MRTVIYLGLIAIADAINKDWFAKETVTFMVIILFIALFMDIAEFLKKMGK